MESSTSQQQHKNISIQIRTFILLNFTKERDSDARVKQSKITSHSQVIKTSEKVKTHQENETKEKNIPSSKYGGYLAYLGTILVAVSILGQAYCLYFYPDVQNTWLNEYEAFYNNSIPQPSIIPMDFEPQEYKEDNYNDASCFK